MCHKIISFVLAQVVREGLIPFNPASRAISPKDARKEAERLETEQLERILEALKEEPQSFASFLSAGAGGEKPPRFSGTGRTSKPELSAWILLPPLWKKIAERDGWSKRKDNNSA